MGKKQTPQEWRNHIRKQKQGNQTRVEYCGNHELALSSFDYWSGRIRKQQNEKNQTIVRVGVLENHKTRHPNEDHPLILHIDDRYRLMISSPVNQEDVRKLIEVLETR
jgi:hypothetical protein